MRLTSLQIKKEDNIINILQGKEELKIYDFKKSISFLTNQQIQKLYEQYGQKFINLILELNADDYDIDPQTLVFILKSININEENVRDVSIIIRMLNDSKKTSEEEIAYQAFKNKIDEINNSKKEDESENTLSLFRESVTLSFYNLDQLISTIIYNNNYKKSLRAFFEQEQGKSINDEPEFNLFIDHPERKEKYLMFLNNVVKENDDFLVELSSEIIKLWMKKFNEKISENKHTSNDEILCDVLASLCKTMLDKKNDLDLIVPRELLIQNMHLYLNNREKFMPEDLIVYILMNKLTDNYTPVFNYKKIDKDMLSKSNIFNELEYAIKVLYQKENEKILLDLMKCNYSGFLFILDIYLSREMTNARSYPQKDEELSILNVLGNDSAVREIQNFWIIYKTLELEKNVGKFDTFCFSVSKTVETEMKKNTFSVFKNEAISFISDVFDEYQSMYGEIKDIQDIRSILLSDKRSDMEKVMLNLSKFKYTLNNEQLKEVSENRLLSIFNVEKYDNNYQCFLEVKYLTEYLDLDISDLMFADKFDIKEVKKYLTDLIVFNIQTGIIDFSKIESSKEYMINVKTFFPNSEELNRLLDASTWGSKDEYRKYHYPKIFDVTFKTFIDFKVEIENSCSIKSDWKKDIMIDFVKSNIIEDLPSYEDFMLNNQEYDVPAYKKEIKKYLK